MRIKKILQNAATSLVALIAACQVRQAGEKSDQIKTGQEQYHIAITPFAFFNPPAVTNVIKVEERIREYLHRGLDGDHPREHLEEARIENDASFERLIYHDARLLGYTPGEVNTMSPKKPSSSLAI